MLYLSLLQKNNSLYWSEFFTVTASELQGLSGLSQSGMQRARKQLVDKGIVIYKKRGSNRAPKYCLPELTNEFVITILNGTPNNTAVNTAVNTPNSTTVNSPNTLIDNTIQYNTKQIDAAADIEKYNSKDNQQKIWHAVASFQKLWNFPNAFQQQDLEELILTYSDELVNEAVKIAGTKDVPKNNAISFLTSALKEWEQANVKTVEQVKQYQASRQTKNKSFNSNYGKRRVEPKELSKPPVRELPSDEEISRMIREREANEQL